MTRAEVYAKIKEYGLQAQVKTIYGLNYTNLTTATLISVVEDYENKYCTCDCDVTALESKLDSLIKVLYDKHILCKSEYDVLR